MRAVPVVVRMSVKALRPMADFGTRSLVTHLVMVVAFLAALASAFLVQGRVGTISFVAFLNFTAGAWVCQAIHSLGNSFTDDEYQGVLRTVLDHVG